MTWASLDNLIKTGLNRALDLVCVQNAYKLNAK